MHAYKRSNKIGAIKMNTITFGVPCSNLKDVWKVDIPCTDEGQAMAMAAGAWFAGKKPIVQIQNSGLGNAVDIITSLYHPYKIPLPEIHIGYRTLPTQHSFMGKITEPLLKLLEYPGDKIRLYSRVGK